MYINSRDNLFFNIFEIICETTIKWLLSYSHHFGFLTLHKNLSFLLLTLLFQIRCLHGPDIPLSSRLTLPKLSTKVLSESCNYCKFSGFFWARDCAHFKALCKIAKTCCWLHHICQPASPSVRPSFRPYGATRLPPVGFSWFFIFDYFSKFCWGNQISLTPDKDNGYFTWRRKCIYGNICLDSSYNEKYYRQKV